MLGRMISEMSKAGVSVERIAYIMNSPVEQDKPGTTEPDLSGDIRFEHVNFAYEGCPEILHDIDFTMPAGSVLGILGGTGSGKSTMMFLLDKLYELPPENGRISIGGVDINDISTPYLRENIGMVLQEPFLFSRSHRREHLHRGRGGRYGRRARGFPRGLPRRDRRGLHAGLRHLCR